MEPSQSIGQRIKAVRGDLSQKEFGTRIGLSQTAVTALENDKSVPRLGTLNRIVLAFAVDPEWLRTGIGKADRALMPMPAHFEEARPAGLSIAQPTREEYAALQDENRKLREELAKKEGTLTAVEGEVTWLRKQVGGKTEASADAATDYDEEPVYMEAHRNHEYDYAAQVAAHSRPAVSCWMDFAS